MARRWAVNDGHSRRALLRGTMIPAEAAPALADKYSALHKKVARFTQKCIL
jgi:hypothetical protein